MSWYHLFGSAVILQWKVSDLPFLEDWEARIRIQCKEPLLTQVMQNGCKDLSVTGEGGSSWLIVMVQFANSSKLVFILFLSIKCCAMYLSGDCAGGIGRACKCKLYALVGKERKEKKHLLKMSRHHKEQLARFKILPASIHGRKHKHKDSKSHQASLGSRHFIRVN